MCRVFWNFTTSKNWQNTALWLAVAVMLVGYSDADDYQTIETIEHGDDSDAASDTTSSSHITLLAGTYKIWDGSMTKSFLVFRRQTVLEKFCTHKVPPVKWTRWLSNSPSISTFHEWCSSSRCLINRPVVGPRLEAVECCQLPVCEWWPGASHWAHGHHLSWDCESSRSGSSWSN